MDMGARSLEYAVSGVQQGAMRLDKANGLLLSVDITQHLSGEVTMNGSTSWPIEIQTKNIMETER